MLVAYLRRWADAAVLADDPGVEGVYARRMREDAQELLVRALKQTARRMEQYNLTIPAQRLGEIDHLRPALDPALTQAAAKLSLPATVTREHPFQTVDWVSRAGVDVAVRGLPGLAPVFGELKWGDGRRLLGECSWDLAKMGLAVAKGACSAAFLLAGAPRKRWDNPDIEGAELFVDGRHGLDHVRGPLYMKKYWRKYALEPLPQPKWLPSAFETTVLAVEPMALDDGPWELRCIEVVGTGDLVDIPPLPSMRSEPSA